ncbi:MAG: hypothetical protein LBK66_01185 [Spirochaetaceae bacterium]|jgi:hypothetical protein|nr:hypothetical protein [Spirochaetaceae bacterium]
MIPRCLGRGGSLPSSLILIEADYILAVKENQKWLYEDIKDYFEWMESGEIGEQLGMSNYQ